MLKEGWPTGQHRAGSAVMAAWSIRSPSAAVTAYIGSPPVSIWLASAPRRAIRDEIGGDTPCRLTTDEIVAVDPGAVRQGDRVAHRVRAGPREPSGGDPPVLDP
ncbi:hypothetical protein [Nocardia pneumoniae]|uniref:hypothetical protein n=1 Tax=Nocardia pneumoniae TaxID=228601 RepID=UPI00031272ED|nr:hypothetical protein [Nocardia pneumoniae]